MNLKKAALLISFATLAIPAGAGDAQYCGAILKVVEEAIEARTAGHSEKALLASIDPKLKADRNTFKIITAATRYVYTVDKRTLPHAAKMFHANCIAQK